MMYPLDPMLVHERWSLMLSMSLLFESGFREEVVSGYPLLCVPPTIWTFNQFVQMELLQLMGCGFGGCLCWWIMLGA